LRGFAKQLRGWIIGLVDWWIDVGANNERRTLNAERIEQQQPETRNLKPETKSCVSGH
jgi:hypothetical protein